MCATVMANTMARNVWPVPRRRRTIEGLVLVIMAPLREGRRPHGRYRRLGVSDKGSVAARRRNDPVKSAQGTCCNNMIFKKMRRFFRTRRLLWRHAITLREAKGDDAIVGWCGGRSKTYLAAPLSAGDIGARIDSGY